MVTSSLNTSLKMTGYPQLILAKSAKSYLRKKPQKMTAKGVPFK